MKIGVNARLLTKPFTGIGQYTKNLFKNLGEIDKKNQYLLVVTEKIDPAILKEFPKNIKVFVLEEKGNTGTTKTYWEQILLPDFFRKQKVDIAFFTYPSNPWSNDFYKTGIKTVTTVHDCIPWKFKKYRRGILSKMYHSQTKKAVKKSDVIFTVSEHSKKDIVEFCGVEKGKIFVVHNDASDTYKKPANKKLTEKLLKDFEIEKGKYFFYVGGFDDRKNVSGLIDSFEKFSKGKDLKLVLAGGKLFKNSLYSSFDIGKENKNVVLTGFLTEEELKALYSGCRAFVHFSKEEGFNIPLLEASNCGAPLILSDIPVHREVAGNYASFEKWTIKNVDTRKLAKKYSWKASAQKVLDVLNSLM